LSHSNRQFLKKSFKYDFANAAPTARAATQQNVDLLVESLPLNRDMSKSEPIQANSPATTLHGAATGENNLLTLDGDLLAGSLTDTNDRYTLVDGENPLPDILAESPVIIAFQAAA
jgi:hypothetical protein